MRISSHASTIARRFGTLGPLLAIVSLCTLPAQSQAALISVVSSIPTAAVGQQFTVDYLISGLSGAAGDSLSAFDLDVQYDATLFSFGGGSYFDVDGATNRMDLPEAGSFGFIGDTAPAGPGVIDAFGISGNSATVLDTLQPEGFRFLSLSFTALTNGAGAFAIDLLDPSLLFIDSTFLDLPVTFGNTSVDVSVGATSVAEPGTLLLLLIALGAAVLGGTGKFRTHRTGQQPRTSH